MSTQQPTRLSLPRVRRDPRWLAGGLVAVALGGLASAYGFATVAASEPVIKVNRTVHRGEVLQASDLAVVQVGRSADLKGVPASQLDVVVGKAATTDLPGGTLLVAESVGAAEVPAGAARVGLRLVAGRYPSTPMLPGTKVLVVALPAKAAGVSPGAPAVASVPAVLVGTPSVQPDGSAVLDVNVPVNQAETIARLAASEQVVLVRQGDEQ